MAESTGLVQAVEPPDFSVGKHYANQYKYSLSLHQ